MSSLRTWRRSDCASANLPRNCSFPAHSNSVINLAAAPVRSSSAKKLVGPRILSTHSSRIDFASWSETIGSMSFCVETDAFYRDALSQLHTPTILLTELRFSAILIMKSATSEREILKPKRGRWPSRTRYFPLRGLSVSWGGRTIVQSSPLF